MLRCSRLKIGHCLCKVKPTYLRNRSLIKSTTEVQKAHKSCRQTEQRKRVARASQAQCRNSKHGTRMPWPCTCSTQLTPSAWATRTVGWSGVYQMWGQFTCTNALSLEGN